MKNDIKLINKLYKPHKITKKGKSTIIECGEGKYSIKKTDKDLKKLYTYLSNRGFDNYPKVIDDTRNSFNIYEYIEDSEYPKEQRAMDMIDLVSDLHNKTSYYKEVREDKFKEVYDDLNNNLLYYKNNYDELTREIEKEDFMSPSHYLFIRSSSKLYGSIKFCEDNLNKWYDDVKDKRYTKICLNHNNLELDHFRKKDKPYLISFENYKMDSPILDIYKLYKNECLNVEFKKILDRYFNNVDIDNDDKKLFLIMICMPEKIEFSKNEYESCKKIERKLDYIYKTEELVRKYYLANEEKESD